MEILIVIVGLVLFIGVRLYVPLYLTRRCLKTVVNVLKTQGAYSSETGRTLEELNIGPKGFGRQFSRMGTYRLKALQALREAQIVEATEDEKMFLHVENLKASKLVETWPSLLEGL